MERMDQLTRRLLEAYHHGDRALPAQLLRRTSSSGFLRRVIMHLAQIKNGPRNHELGLKIITRVAARHMRGARTPEVRMTFAVFFII
jgi:hypothetical protein